MAQAIHRLSDEVEVLGPVALDHPLIRHAVARAARGVRVLTLLSDLSVPQRSGYIGLDNHKAGRTAAGLSSAYAGEWRNWHYHWR